MSVVPGTALSPREEQILMFIRTTDYSYRQIGLELALKRSTVATHAQRAFTRLEVCGKAGYLRSLVAPAPARRP